MDISTKFMGIEIKSPIIIGSCDLTSNINNLKKIEEAGAGGVILKSLFEEEITQEMNINVRVFSASFSGYPEAYDYIKQSTKHESIEKYLDLIRQAKKELSIPVIASINCITASEWMSFIKKIEDAGADGIELNMFLLPSDVNLSHEDVERFYEDVVQIVKRASSLPISLKISNYFTSLTRFVQKISWMGISNLNIFNRFYSSDIDINTLETKSVAKFSSQYEFYNVLRWTSILSGQIRCGLTSGTGVYRTEDPIKLLLAGADTVQVVSAIHTEGMNFITQANDRLKEWMETKNYKSLDDFKGKMSIGKSNESASFQRVQYMKYFSGL